MPENFQTVSEGQFYEVRLLRMRRKGREYPYRRLAPQATSRMRGCLLDCRRTDVTFNSVPPTTSDRAQRSLGVAVFVQ